MRLADRATPPAPRREGTWMRGALAMVAALSALLWVIACGSRIVSSRFTKQLYEFFCGPVLPRGCDLYTASATQHWRHRIVCATAHGMLCHSARPSHFSPKCDAGSTYQRQSCARVRSCACSGYSQWQLCMRASKLCRFSATATKLIAADVRMQARPSCRRHLQIGRTQRCALKLWQHECSDAASCDGKLAHRFKN